VVVSFIGEANPGKTTDLPQVADKHYPIMVYRAYLDISGIRSHYLVMIGTDCTGICKSNYHAIITTRAPRLKQLLH